MAVNRGKDFENQIKEAFERMPHTSVTRLIDPQSGYAGVRNICDFIMYHYPIQYFIECKSCYGNTLPFSNITKNQWDGLLEKSSIKGVVAGYMIWFIDHDLTCFITAQQMQMLKDKGCKSVNVHTFPLELDGDWIYIRGTKKRVLFDYDMTNFLEECEDKLWDK